jgi:hypothetical protein
MMRPKIDTNHAYAVAEESILHLREMRQLVDTQAVNLSALVFENVRFMLAVAKKYLGPVPEPHLVLDDLAPTC